MLDSGHTGPSSVMAPRAINDESIRLAVRALQCRLQPYFSEDLKVFEGGAPSQEDIERGLDIDPTTCWALLEERVYLKRNGIFWFLRRRLRINNDRMVVFVTKYETTGGVSVEVHGELFLPLVKDQFKQEGADLNTISFRTAT